MTDFKVDIFLEFFNELLLLAFRYYLSYYISS